MERKEQVDRLPVSEIFFSIQGEGVYAGTPSVFLRTYFCNLTCVWCDTKYTWIDQKEAEEGVQFRRMDEEEVYSMITRYECPHLVVTGGEPLMHQNKLYRTLRRLKSSGFFIEVETNGTIVPIEEVLAAVDSFNVSPKISNSLVSLELRTRPTVLKRFVDSGKAWFKFVICTPDDVSEVEELIASNNLPRERVILMPEGTDLETISERSRWLVEVCKQHKFRYGPRLHIQLWGNKRGT